MTPPDRRRKTKDELRAELLDRTGGSDTDDDTASISGDGFCAISDAERADVNHLFGLLHEHGYLTHGSYSITKLESGETSIALNAFLPSSIDGMERYDAG